MFVLHYTSYLSAARSLVPETTAPTSRSFACRAVPCSPRAMADVSNPLGASPANRKKVVLLGFGGQKELEVNNRLFDWANVNIVDEEDDVYVVHFTRTKKTGMSAIRTASTQRAGVTVVDIAALATKEDDSVRPKVPPEWVPSAVIDAMNKRRSACHSCAASVFEVDLDAGFGTAEVRRRQ